MTEFYEARYKAFRSAIVQLCRLNRKELKNLRKDLQRILALLDVHQPAKAKELVKKLINNIEV